MNGMSAHWSFRARICVTYCMCYFVGIFRSLSFLVKLEQLDLGSNELEVLVNQQFVPFNLIIYNLVIILRTVVCPHVILSCDLKRPICSTRTE